MNTDFRIADTLRLTSRLRFANNAFKEMLLYFHLPQWLLRLSQLSSGLQQDILTPDIRPNSAWKDLNGATSCVGRSEYGELGYRHELC
jgi:hypothetical protein